MNPSGEAHVRVAILGPVLVENRHGVLVPPPGARSGALLQSLALSRTHAVSSAALIDDLWADEPPVNARAALQTLVSRLRAMAAVNLVVSTETGYRLDPSPGTTDLDLARVLRDRAAALAAADPAGAMTEIDRALSLWRAEPADLPAPTTDLHRTLTRSRAELLSIVGDHSEALAVWNALAEASPFDETVTIERMRALTTLGRPSDALLVFSEFRSLLRDELGSSPSGALVALNTRLLHEDAGATMPAPAAVPQLRIGLRNPPNDLLGREEDIQSVERALGETRLVTILGAGGLGKTRLAQELAHRSSASAVIVVELASVGTDDDVTFALASTLGITERLPGQRLADAPINDLRSLIIRQLSERDTLLVIDNCEHVIDGAARWVSDILASTSSVRVITTSRSPLAIGGERVYPLAPLPSTLGASDLGPAVRLFCERASAARPGAALPLDTIARLCTRLDGLPLAIELAAARVRSMSVDEIEHRLEDRFALLVGGDRAGAKRHRTLQAVIEWSWNLLSPIERTALGRLSLFPDGFGAEAARHVATPDVDPDAPDLVLDILDGLVSQSLLGVREDAATGALRYRMLETVREFGARELHRVGDEQAARTALLGWAETFSLAAFPRLDGATQLDAYGEIRREHDTLLWALRTSLVSGPPQVVVSVFAALAFYWTMRGTNSEVIAFGPSVLRAMRGYRPDAAHAESTLASAVLAGTILLLTGSRDGALALSTIRKLDAVRRLSADPYPIAPRLDALADFLLGSLDPQNSTAKLEAMQNSRDPATALIGGLMGVQLAENDGELERAQWLGAKTYQLATQHHDVWIASMSAMLLGQLASQNNQPTDALDWIDRAATGLGRLGADDDVRQLAWIKGANLVSIGKLDEAMTVFDGFSNAFASPDELDLRSVTTAGHAEVARALGRFDDGAALYLTAVQMHVTGRERTSPWFTMLTASLICAWVGDGTGEPESVREHSRVLRSRVLAVRRARPTQVDKPVLGTAALGYAVWAMTEPSRAELGLELLVLAEAMHGRQDLPALHMDAHVARAAMQFSAEAIADARAAAATLSLDERAHRAHELFARPMDDYGSAGGSAGGSRPCACTPAR